MKPNRKECFKRKDLLAEEAMREVGFEAVTPVT
jgi:hypothetical protein